MVIKSYHLVMVSPLCLSFNLTKFINIDIGTVVAVIIFSK